MTADPCTTNTATARSCSTVQQRVQADHVQPSTGSLIVFTDSIREWWPGQMCLKLMTALGCALRSVGASGQPADHEH